MPHWTEQRLTLQRLSLPRDGPSRQLGQPETQPLPSCALLLLLCISNTSFPGPLSAAATRQGSFCKRLFSSVILHLISLLSHLGAGHSLLASSMSRDTFLTKQLQKHQTATKIYSNPPPTTLIPFPWCLLVLPAIFIPLGLWSAASPFQESPDYPRYLPKCPCIWRPSSLTFCPCNHITTTSRAAVPWPGILFLIYLPSLRASPARCVCASDILYPLKLPGPELPSGEPGSLSYSQLDEQQFSRGEHSKLKPLVPGRYICWLFNPNLKSEVHIFYFSKAAMLQCHLQNSVWWVSFTQPCSSDLPANFILEGDALVLLGLLLVFLVWHCSVLH